MSVLKLLPTGWSWAINDDQRVSNACNGDSEHGEGWTTCTTFPTEIHDELRSAGVIPDWNIGANEHQVQWVSKKSWKFKASIQVEAAVLTRPVKAELLLESIDTFATILFNGVKVLETDNHFRIWRVPIAHSLLQSMNELVIIIDPPQSRAQRVADVHGPFKGGSCNLGDRSRIGIRKAQYHARWDWGPELWCMGIDRPVSFLIYESRIKSVQTSARVGEDLSTSLAVEVETEGYYTDIRVKVFDKDGRPILNESIPSGEGEWDVVADLWWPVNEGRQILYDVVVDLYNSDGLVDTHTRKIGFRSVELVQHVLDGQTGSSFFFKINGKAIFIGGSNWIPIDTVLATGTKARYERWLDLMVKGGQNMIRVWGGGVFEPDCFYEMCDQKGLLVWQDFMFACGVYPIFPDFLASVEAEARENLERLRHHPSLVMLCGNNEDYQQIEQWSMDKGGDPLPARLIYEKLLPDLIQELVEPPIPYWPGSPYGGAGWDTADPTVGDVHQWDVWAGKETNYMDWDRLGGRFVSEFGLPSFPDRRTVDFWLNGDTAQAYPQSKLMQQHNKAGSYERRFATVMNENFRLTGDLTEYIFRNQLMQAEGVGEAYRTWRRQWKGTGREYCGGVLVWQLNDCWPVTSWALVDYFYRPKPAYFAVKRALRPISIGALRIVEKNREHDRPRQYYEYGAFQTGKAAIEVWASNSGSEQIVNLRLMALELLTGQQQRIFSGDVTLLANATTEVWSGSLAPSCKGTGNTVVHAVITDATGAVTRYDDWPQPYKFLDLPDPGIVGEICDGVLYLRSRYAAKALWLDVEGPSEGVEWDQNSIDLYPGESYEVAVRGTEGKVITYSSLGWEKPRRLNG